MKTLNDDSMNLKQRKFSGIDIIGMLRENKKIVPFIGASKSGTSFMINNIGRILANRGCDVAILDATRSRSSYYIYTKNDVKIKNKVNNCIENLSRGIAQGLKVKDNLTIYTGPPGEDENLNDVDSVLRNISGKSYSYFN